MSLFRNREAAKQLVDYSCMQFGERKNLRPTDVDASMDLAGKGFIFFEVKHDGANLPIGQRIYLENLMKAMKVPAVAFQVVHNTPVNKDVDLGNCRVTQYIRNNGKGWQPTFKQGLTAREAAEYFIYTLENDFVEQKFLGES